MEITILKWMFQVPSRYFVQSLFTVSSLYLGFDPVATSDCTKISAEKNLPLSRIQEIWVFPKIGYPKMDGS